MVVTVGYFGVVACATSSTHHPYPGVGDQRLASRPADARPRSQEFANLTGKAKQAKSGEQKAKYQIEKIQKPNPAEIEAVIARVKQSNIEQRDVELIERLLRT